MPVVPADALVFRDLPGRRAADPLGGAGGVSMRLVHVPHTPDRRPHRHPSSVEVVYVAAGRGRVWEDGEVTPVAAGDCILFPAGVPHAALPDPGTPMTLVCFFPVADPATEEL